jgi:thioesterase domain-containing protein
LWLVAGFAAALGVPRDDLGRALESAVGLAGRALLTHILGRAGGAAGLDVDDAAQRFARFRRDLEAWSRYAARPYPGSALFLQAASHDAWSAGTPADWAPFVRGDLETRVIPGDHFSLLRPPHVAELALALGEHLGRLELVHGLHRNQR